MKSLIFLSFVAITFFSACKPAADNKPVLRGVIDPVTARRLVRNFGDAYGSQGTRRKSFPGILPDESETRCVWFGKEQLKAIVDSMNNVKGDGIRFYFAIYDKQAIADYKVDPTYDTYATLIMVPTRPDSAMDDKSKKILIHVDTIDLKKSMILTTSPQNRGELCPPPNICDQYGTQLLQN